MPYSNFTLSKVVEEFQLTIIESSPAWEFINGCVIQKPMPTLFHKESDRIICGTR